VNPVSIVVNAVRDLTLPPPYVTNQLTHVLQALAWIVGILVVFVPLSVRRYRKAA
jgi:hypothetical protein